MSKVSRRRLGRVVQLRWPELTADEADALVRDGRVRVDGVVLDNPAALVPARAQMVRTVSAPLQGTRKLTWALEHFGVDAAGRVALDVGASTGGFTQALLDAGAATVYAVDAGHGQLLGSLRQDARVVNLERTNVSALSTALVPAGLGVATVDVSYLSLSSAVAQMAGLSWTPGAELLGLVKPMFELRLPTIPTDAGTLTQARDAAMAGIEGAGWEIVAAAECPVRGHRGAVEFVVHGRRVLGHADGDG